MDLNPGQARALWVTALRSGDYRQATTGLFEDYDGRFCVQGVAFILYLAFHPQDQREFPRSNMDPAGGRMCPSSIGERLGSTWVGSATNLPTTILPRQNNRGVPFSLLADRIQSDEYDLFGGALEISDELAEWSERTHQQILSPVKQFSHHLAVREARRLERSF